MVKPGYKQTEIGVIPEDWEVKRLGGIATIATGNTPPTNDASNYGEDFPFVGPVDLGETKFISRTEKRLSEKGFAMARRFPKGSILFVSIGSTIGKCGLAPVELTSNQQINAIFPSPVFSSDYLFYAVSSAAPRIKAQAGEQAVPIVNKTQFSETEIALPSLPEQKVIATALSDADELIGVQERLLTKKRQIKQGAMQELLTGKKRLPGFTGEWEVKQLGEVASISMGQSPDSKNYNRTGNGVPLIQGNADIEDHRSIARVWTTQITKEGSAGDLLLTVRAPVGAVGRISERCCLGRGVCSLSPIGDADFLFHLLIFTERAWKVLEQGSTFTSANSTQVNAFSISMPTDHSEQTAIAEVLSDMDAEIEALETKLTKARQVKQGMMQKLLTGRIRLV